MLDTLERGARAMARLQDARGAIIDPYLRREFQYSTPYFAYAVGVLLKHGRGKDLRAAGLLAMEHATSCFAGGAARIPDRHGEFYIPALAEALEVYHGIAPEAQWNQWRERLRTPLLRVIDGYQQHTNNWRAYAMRGEWLRVRPGLADRNAAVDFIERSWADSQRDRMAKSQWNLYLDHSSDPNSQAVEAVGRGNLLGLLAGGYDGPSAKEMRGMVDRATRMSLLLQDPTGQAPPNGRTDDHVWNDILYQLCFEVSAEESLRAGDRELAQRYRRAANIAFRSALRWQLPDGAFQVTKNFFPNELRVGYQPASQWTNYNGAVLIHLAEAIEARQSEIADSPALSETGGYAFANDPQFGSAFANAGGMQMMVNLRGEVDPARYNIYWTPLGLARFSRMGWDSRLGPLDGVRDTHSKVGVSFGPSWKQGVNHVRLASLPERYRGTFEVDLATPALVLCRVVFRPPDGAKGAWFTWRVAVTPDGVLIRQSAEGSADAGFTLPLMVDDGKTKMTVRVSNGIASIRNPAGDEQAFIANGEVEEDGDAIRSPAGWLKPVFARASEVFVYPRGPNDPSADEVRAKMRVEADGFVSPVVRVQERVAVGRTYAGGSARTVDIDGDGKPEIVFSEEVSFTAKTQGGRVVAIETAHDVEATIGGRSFHLKTHEPAAIRR